MLTNNKISNDLLVHKTSFGYKGTAKGTSKNLNIKLQKHAKSHFMGQLRSIDKKHNQVQQMTLSSLNSVTQHANKPENLTSTKWSTKPPHKKSSSTGNLSTCSVISYPKRSDQSIEQTARSSISLTNLFESEDVNYSLLTSEEIRLLQIPTCEMNLGESTHEKRPFNSIEEFDLVRNSSLFNGWQKDLWPFPSQLPISPSSTEPVSLKKRAYSYEILIAKSSANFKANTQNVPNDQVRRLSEKSDYDDTDPSFTSEDSDESLSYDGPNFVSETKHFYSPSRDEKCNASLETTCNDLSSPTSILIVQKPILLKCMVDDTEDMKELLIYSDEYLQALKEEMGRTISKKDILKKSLESSEIYEGKSLRIIVDPQKIFSNLNNNGSPEETKAGLGKNFTSPNSSTLIQQGRKTTSIPSTSFEYIPSTNWVKRQKKLIVQKLFQEKNSELNDSTVGTAKRWNRKKFKIPLPRTSYEKGDGRISRMALKRVNIDEIIESDFRQFFHFYAKFGGRLKSGVVISKLNNYFWLKRCRMIDDNFTHWIAEQCFAEVARKKLVLNISDYVHYLMALARKRNMVLQDVIHQLMSIDPYSSVNTEIQSDMGVHQQTRK